MNRIKASSLFILLVAILSLTQIGCNETVPPPEPDSWFMLGIINYPNTVPVDFDAISISGDYKPSTGLLRVQGSNANDRDKIEFTIKKAVAGVVGDYPIGDFNSSATNARAEYIDLTSVWDAKSTSGNLNITKFVESATANTYLLSGTYTFKATASGGEIEVTNGEIKNAVLLVD